VSCIFIICTFVQHGEAFYAQHCLQNFCVTEHVLWSCDTCEPLYLGEDEGGESGMMSNLRMQCTGDSLIKIVSMTCF